MRDLYITVNRRGADGFGAPLLAVNDPAVVRATIKAINRACGIRIATNITKVQVQQPGQADER